MSAVFIAFEGGDASGKTTQAQLLADRLDALFTREPGGTALGETLRDLVLRPDAAVDLRAEALIIAAARAQHVAEVVRPALQSGRSVITDRFTGSSLAYQGYASGLDVEAVRALSEFATDGLSPDVTVLVDVPVEVSLARVGASPDRFEQEADDFHSKVRAGYLELVDEDDSWVRVDGSGSVEEVSSRVTTVLARFL
ncbi:MAG: dTMP kinase [Acidimicrobiales bacterium]